MPENTLPRRKPLPHFAIQLTLFWLLVSLVIVSAQGQTQCRVVNNINYPIDTGVFQLVQDYGVASPRHQGRFHTGEDWYGGRSVSFGQPVRAAAAGRVTYSSPLGWGRDGGVVIIEHTFPDGTTAYTQYGHMAETTTVTFPERFSCVEAGDVIGAVGDVRPAPHLHFEVRVANPDTPGPGYSREVPFDEGWRSPERFVTNWQAWLHPAHRWHVEQGDAQGPIVPPLVLNDNSTLYVEGRTLRRATNDGRVLWRVGLERRPVSITGFQGAPLITYADGTMQTISPEGAPIDTWRVDFSPDRAPLAAGNLLIFHTSDGALVAIDSTRRAIAWRLDGVPDFVRAHVAGDAETFTIGLITAEDDILTISRAQGIVYQGRLRDVGSFATAPDGALMAYTRSGLWRIDSSGTWSPAMDDVPAGNSSSAIVVTAEGRTYLFDGTMLHAYLNNQLLWEIPVDGITGLATLNQYGSVLLLTTTHGHIITVNDAGRYCGQMRIYGDNTTRVWHNLGSDGILRISVGAQVMGLDWNQFIGACRG